MNPLMAKEIRLLRPAYAMAMLLAVIPLWLLPTQESGAEFIMCVALIFGTLMMALSSFGREFGMNTFPLMLAQPLTRVRIWRTKVGVLAGAIATVWLGFLVSWAVNYSFKAGNFSWFTRNVAADLLAAGLLLLAAFVILASGLWATLLLRQMVAAFWFALLVPVVMLVVLDWKGATTLTISIAFIAYSVMGFWWAWRLFRKAQEAAWTGGEVTLPAWQSSRTASEATTRPFRPIRALFWKELKLQQIAILGMGALFLLHLGIVLIRKATHGAIENPLVETVLEMFGGIWFIVPVVTSSLNVADERRLGTMEGHLCLPVSSRVQFVIKLLVVMVLSGCLSSLLLWVAEGMGSTIGAGVLFGGGVSTPGARADLPSFPIWAAVFSAPIFISISLISFYASTLSRNIMQSVATAVAVGIVLSSAGAIAESLHQIDSSTLWQGPLLTIIGWPTMAVALVWLAYGNFRRLSETRRLWLRNICGLGFTMLGIATVTAGLYNRAWELLTPLEPPHGLARLNAEQPPILHADYWGGISIVLPDGRLWHDRFVYGPGHRLITFADNRVFGWGGKLSSVITGDHFIEGSNWVDEAHNAWGETAAIRSDGTLWISEKGTQPFWENARPVPQPAAKLIQFGSDTNWKRVATQMGQHAMILLKTDGTLWRWGSNRSDGRLADIKPHRLGNESDWAEINSNGSSLFARKTDGRVWNIYFWTKDTQNDQLRLDPETVISRWEVLDKVKWRSVAWCPPGQLGVREDGTLWTLSPHYESPRSVREELVQIGNATNWISVVGDNRMLMALKADGSLWKWEWERNAWQFEQQWAVTHPPTHLGIHNDWVAIGSGWNGIVALAADGSLWIWLDYSFNPASLLAPPTRKPTKLENIFDENK